LPFAAPWLFPRDHALLKALNDSVCYDLINICFFHSLSFCFGFDLLDLGNNISLASLIVKIFFSLFLITPGMPEECTRFLASKIKA